MSNNPEWLTIINKEKQEKSGRLDLGGCQLEEIPKELLEMEWLKSLSLSRNKISTIDNLQNLKLLEFLSLHTNQISKIECLRPLKQLVELELDSNLIERIENIEELEKLETLTLFYNKIKKIENLESQKKLKVLFLSTNHIEAIENLETLTELTDLYLHNNEIKKIENLENLTSLENLSLYSNQIKKIENLEGQEKRLKTLRLDSNKIEVIENLENLTGLETLSLNGNQIKKLENLEEQEKSLKSLSLDINQIEIIENLNKLESLEVLTITKNKIEKLQGLTNNTQLKKIDLNDNLISGSIEELKHNPELNFLGLSNNKIDDISILSNHTKLEDLYLSQNPLSSIDVLKLLPNLKRVVLSNTGLTSLRLLLPIIKKGIPVKLVYGFEDSGEGIFIKDNSNLDISKEIMEQGNDAIIQFYELQQNKSHALDEIYLNEAKLILVGEGKVGKTSLRIKLIDPNDSLPKEDERTRGIDIADYDFQLKNKNVYKAHIWDFGGQNIQYALHRFFMTENSLYILMTESRNERDKSFNYWFQNIDLFGGKDSPILIVMNLMFGDRGANIDIASYVTEFKKIVNNEILEVNLLNPQQDDGLLKLRTIIEQQLENLPHIRKPIFRCWLDVREALQVEATKSPYIHIERYQEICIEKGVEEPYFELVGRYLHNLGIVLWYHDKEYLQNKMILNPMWAISAIYKIIDDKKIQDNKGKFDNEDKNRLWSDASYKFSKDELTSLLKVFKICFQRFNKNEYIVPALMEANQPGIAKDWEYKGCITVTFEYVFMPKGIANQLTADLHQHIQDELNHVWAYGVVLHYAEDEDTLAMIVENTYNRRISIDVKGNYANRFMGIIIQELKNINNSYMGLKSEMKIPCSCDKCKTLSSPQLYTEQDLLERLKEGKTEVYCNKLDSKVNIQPVLESVGITHPIFDKLKRGVDEELIASLRYKEKKTKKKVFISYSHNDTKWLKNLNKHLSGLRHSGLIDAWTDQEILAGEKWDKKIKDNMEQADVFICLLSADFVASDYIWNTELKTVFEKIKKKNAKVIFIYVEPFDLGSIKGSKISDDLSDTTILDFEIIPKDINGHLKAAGLWENENLALTTIVKRIREAIEDKQIVTT